MNAPRVAVAVAAVLAVSATGCKTGDADTAKPAAPASAQEKKAPPAPKAAGAQAAPKAAAQAQPVAPPESRPAPTTPAATTGDGRLGPLVQEREILRERREQLVRSYTELADKAYADSRFEDAEQMYGNVLDLDPKNEHAQRRLDEVGAILGKRPMEDRTAFRNAVESAQVRAQMAKVEVQNLAAQADARAKLGDYEGAATLYDRALVIVGLYPANADFTPSAEGLKRLRDAARSAATGASEARRRQILKEAADQAAVDAAKQRSARRERIRTLFEKANQAVERGDYQTARNLAEEILASEPSNNDAKRLRRIAVDARSEEMDEGYRRELLDEWKHVFEALGEAYAPQIDDYTFPTTWQEIQAQRLAPKIGPAHGGTVDPEDREVMNRLEGTRASVHFQNTTLDEAVEYLRRLSGVNIIVTSAAREGKSDADLTIESLTLEQPVPVSEVLKLITRLKNLAWTVENGIVQITTPAAAQGVSVVQLYDVKDLATPIVNFPGEEVNLDPKGEHQTTEEAKEPVPEFVLEQISELITNNVDKSVWEGGATVETVPPGTLVVKCPPATHAHVQQLLDGLRGAGGLQVSIETRFITVQDNFLQDIGVDLRGLGDNTGGLGVPAKGGIPGPGGLRTSVTFDDLFFGAPGNPGAGNPNQSIGTSNDVGVFYQVSRSRGDDIRARFENLYDVTLGRTGVISNAGGLSFQGTLIDDTQLEVILRAVQKSQRSTLVTAPRLTAYNGQRANVTVLTQQSYISDFDVEIAQASQIGDPIVQTIRDGVILDIRPVVSADRRFITMELRPTVAILTRPIATFQTTLANGPPVTIQLPELAVQRVRTTVTVPDGGTLLLGGLKFFQEKRVESTVPFLDKIPILSFFTSRKGTSLEKRNVLVLMRAQILRPEENEPGTGRRL